MCFADIILSMEDAKTTIVAETKTAMYSFHQPNCSRKQIYIHHKERSGCYPIGNLTKNNSFFNLMNKIYKNQIFTF